MTSMGCSTRWFVTRWASRAEMAATPQVITLGRPRLHLRSTTSTNDRARELAIAGAPHGTLVTAAEQTAGRGRQGRSWAAPAGSSLLMSLVLPSGPKRLPQGGASLHGAHSHCPTAPLPLLAAVAVCDVVGPAARVKWPNDIVVQDGVELRKLAGILTEGRPQEGWAVLGIGLNVAVRLEELPSELRGTAATLRLTPDAIEPTLASLLAALESCLGGSAETTLQAWRELDALRGREVSWLEGNRRRRGVAEGIDDSGRLIVTTAGSSRAMLDAGEVRLTTSCASSS
jgi:BirA family transcriptional regulator, biotin operon repressor / biotin---[acetyl-CoA-carboxylase] ligase